jgi:hypothetical protein
LCRCGPNRSGNAERYRIFEKPAKPPAPSERAKALERKRTELSRVRASLAQPGLRAGLFAALKAQERSLLQEIAEIEKS